MNLRFCFFVFSQIVFCTKILGTGVTLEHSPGFLNSTAINTETFSEKLDLSAGMAIYERMYAYVHIYVLYRIFKTGVRNVTYF